MARMLTNGVRLYRPNLNKLKSWAPGRLSRHPQTPILFPANMCSDINATRTERLPNTKHIDTRFHFVREVVNNDILSISYCPTDEMIADIFTKPLARFKFEKFRSLLGIF